MHGYRRTDARKVMNLSGIAKLFLGGRCRAKLDEFAKTGSSIGKSPGRYFDSESV
jgi:hypothetical protein